ncbi:MAG: hypothetical protein P8R43_06540 [Planctomycetota bacterium]|nr:hypothetical protein [Planctomycetota bacterium]
MRRTRAPFLLLLAALPALGLQVRSTDLERRMAAIERWRPTVEERLERIERSRASRITASNAQAGDQVLSVSISNKRFDRAGAEDNRPWRQVDTIWWDTTYEAYGLQKDARSIQGLLQFCDLFGDTKFEVKVNINDPIRAKGRHRGPSSGVDFEKDDKGHQWLASTKLQDMTFRFRVRRILYQDGSQEEF